jgi:transcriptional regulator with XRE-family HTH domain
MEQAASFGRLCRALRSRQGRTLRQFCLDHGFDPGNYSKIERDIAAPPESPEKLGAYARAFGLQEGSTDWDEFFSLAAIRQGRIPASILSDQQLLARLPLVFRTMQGGPVSSEQLDELIELIRKDQLDDPTASSALSL